MSYRAKVTIEVTPPEVVNASYIDALRDGLKAAIHRLLADYDMAAQQVTVEIKGYAARAVSASLCPTCGGTYFGDHTCSLSSSSSVVAGVTREADTT